MPLRCPTDPAGLTDFPFPSMSVRAAIPASPRKRADAASVVAPMAPGGVSAILL